MKLITITTMSRKAVTLIEVIFSMGVILIGLLGLMSILPLAGHRAQDAIGLNVGAGIGENVIDELISRKLLTSGRLRTISPKSDVASAVVPTTIAIPFCIDPLMGLPMADPSKPPTPVDMMLETDYSPGFFPYYFPAHDPTKDPLTINVLGSRPTILRVGIDNGGGDFVSYAESMSLVESPDDLAVTQPDDDRAKPANLMAGNLSAGGLEYGTRVPSGEFTWIATVVPLPSGTPSGTYASVTVVVRRKRERLYAPPTLTITPISDANEHDNADGERLAGVIYAAGFKGGSGGVVRIVSAGNTNAKIYSGDWVMLSATDVFGTAIHRWYRVASVNGDPDIDAVANTWTHTVLLDGPDWPFDTSVTPPTPVTYATILKDVVSVTERVVLLSEI